MNAQLPDIDLEGDLLDAIGALEIHAVLAVRLYERSPEDFYAVAEQVRRQALAAQRRARREPGERDRRQMLRQVTRVLSTLSLLTDYGPYVEGSGVFASRTPRTNIRSVSSGGLPGQGKRR